MAPNATTEEESMSNTQHAPSQPKIAGVFLLLCIYRLANAWMIRTQFDPDEYWQTLEPAYCLVFGPRGYGCALTWEWTRRWEPSMETAAVENESSINIFLLNAIHGPIRSYISILPTYWFYLGCRSFFDWVQTSSYRYLTHFVQNHASYIISKGPVFLHAITVAAPIDLCVWLVASRLEKLDGAVMNNQSTSWSFWALCLSLTSWFNGYSLIRTYANCFETLCLAAGMVLLGPEVFGCSPSVNRLKSKLAYVIGGLSACVRFSSLAAWIPLGVFLAIRSAKSYEKKANDSSRFNYNVMFLTLFRLCALYGAAGVTLGCLIDRLMYGFWAIPFLGNFHFNVLLGLGSLYGTHPFLWYVYAGIPAICGVTLIPFLLEICALAKELCVAKRSSNSMAESTKARASLLGIITLYVMLHSISGHKEFRFALPILPLVNILAGNAIFRLFHTTTCKKIKKNGVIGALIALNFPHLIYLGVIHQRGPISANKHITDVITKSMMHKTEDTISIHYLMGCHSAPLYSHLHNPNVSSVKAWHLDCSPGCRSQDDLVCESDRFLLDPSAFITAAYGNGNKVFESLGDEQCVLQELENSGYKEIPTFLVIMGNDAAKVRDELTRLDMNHVASIRHAIKFLTWHHHGDSASRQTSTYSDALEIPFLVDVHFDYIEIYKHNN